MARNLAALLALTWAAGARCSFLGANQSAWGVDLRKEACRYCHKLCPISCFVGTCGIHMAYSVRKYESTNQCYSCDPSVSVGVNKDGDYMRCEAHETGVPEGGKSPFAQQQGVKQGPQGPAVPGDAGLAALKAQQQAQLAVAAATKASIYADKAAKAATAKYREISGNSGGEGAQVFSAENMAENHQAATQIRAEEALRVAEAAHTSWKAAMQKYNGELSKLRRQQLVTDQAEKTLESAEATSEKARGQYAAMQAEAKHAVEQAMLSGGSAADKITSQAASEELAGAAQAAHRRLVIAAKEAKAASEKIAIASAMAPCVETSKDEKTGVIGCMSISQKDAQDSQLATPKSIHLVQPSLPQAAAPVSFGLMDRNSIAGLEPEVEEPAVPSEGELEVPSIAQQMTADLAEKLAANPAAVQDASLFAVPQVPFTAEQLPRDGTEQLPNFDLSTISALQKSQRRMLRKGSLHH